MANKKIWELPSWVSSGNTFNNTIPIDNNFVTQKISLSAITEYVQNNINAIFTGNTVSVTYSELYNMVTGSSLNAGVFYLITDFQTCYDQPDFDYNGNPITGVNTYHVATIDPILVLATSENTLSPNAYQPSYPNDKIQYDVNWNVTEATASPAKGRITERIDEFNNRTDYDHRTVLFKRYKYYTRDLFMTGRIISMNQGVVVGDGTLFQSELVVGDIILINSVLSTWNPSSGAFPQYYEVLSISDDTNMTVGGFIYNDFSDSDGFLYEKALTPSILYLNFKQSNITGDTNNFQEFLTFPLGSGYTTINNYIGNFTNLKDWDGNTFILANNVFQSDSVFIDEYVNNKFGNGCYNNTLRDDCSENDVGDYFFNNVIDDDFDSNQIGVYFNNNVITANFQYNRIGRNFENNFITCNNFYRNQIGNDFRDCVVASSDDFQNNVIGNQHNRNLFYSEYINNQIRNGFNQNRIWGSFSANNIGSGFNVNRIYHSFYNNTTSVYFGNWTIGVVSNLGGYVMSDNTFGTNCNGNTVLENFYRNQIGIDFSSNVINSDFYNNKIGNNFSSNQTNSSFHTNQIGENFSSNVIHASSNFSNNIIGSDFLANNTYGIFFDNEIGNSFSTNTLGDSGNLGTYSFQKNKVYSDFGSNVLLGTTQFNEFGFSFGGNQNISTNALQKNKFTNGVTSTDFSTATHVFGYYDCTIYQRPDGNFKLSYYDNSDVLNITNITS